MDIDMVTKKSVKRGVDMDLLPIRDSRKSNKYGVVIVHYVKYTAQNSKNKAL